MIILNDNWKYETVSFLWLLTFCSNSDKKTPVHLCVFLHAPLYPALLIFSHKLCISTLSHSSPSSDLSECQVLCLFPQDLLCLFQQLKSLYYHIYGVTWVFLGCGINTFDITFVCPGCGNSVLKVSIVYTIPISTIRENTSSVKV